MKDRTMRPSRREFVKWLSAGGISVSLSHLALAKEPAFGSRETLPGRGHFNPAAKGAGRVDGVAKVTGAKLYASDFRAADLPGWPATTSHAILVRANDATHVYAGMDLARLDGPAKPSMIVTAADLDRIGTRVPEFYTGDLFCPVGKTPLYLGQPVALLIFEQFDAYDRARLALRDVGFVKFGDETGPVILPDYGAYRFTRVAGATSDAPDVYSPIQAGWVSPSRIQNAALPVWLPLAKETKADYAKAATHGEQIRAQLAKDDPSQLVLDREFETQSVDPMFLEPESGLAWYSDNNGQLELVLGVQSPYEATESIAFMLGKARAPLRPAHINAQFAHVGGGFGGRDHTPFVLYVALAAMFFPGRPVRLAHDRYQQFQGGIKRHPIKMRSRIGIDRKSGKITAFAADHVLDGGGLANFSANVATVAATAAIGIYDIPKVDVTTVAVHSRGVTAGSMRGYGTLQTMTALEVLIDEAASELKVDPIAFRRNNALKQNGRTMTGNPYIVSVRTPEILDKLEKHPVWQQRADFKQKAPEGRLVGTGLACVTKDYGAGADCSLGRVEIDQEGRIAIHCDHVEMGNGIGTALANRVAGHLGTVADEVAVSRVDSYDALGLVTSGDPYTRWIRRPRISPRRTRAGCLRSARRPAHRSVPMSARIRRPRRRASSSASACGRRRSSSGTSPRPIRAPGNGTEHAGRTASSCSTISRRCPCPSLPRPRMRAASSPAQSRTAFRAGPGRARASRCSASRFVPRSMRWRSAAVAASSKGSIASASSFHRPTTTGSAPPTPRCAARWSASRSSARPVSCVSPRPTACSNAARRWCLKWCSASPMAASPWASATRCWKPCHHSKAVPATGSGISAST